MQDGGLVLRKKIKTDLLTNKNNYEKNIAFSFYTFCYN
jgi:hypothetical protein